MRQIAALAAGTLFGLGLTISGVADPNNVLAFLTLNDMWSPNLILVIGSATTVTAIGYLLVKQRSRPICASSFSEPGSSKIDPQLLRGAVLFGFGWGLAGYCPGTAIVGVFQFDTRAMAFLTAFLVGLNAYESGRLYIDRRKHTVARDI